MTMVAAASEAWPKACSVRPTGPFVNPVRNYDAAMGSDGAFSEIPIVDLGRWYSGSPSERAEFAGEITETCHYVGFFIVTNHGVEAELFGSVFSTMERFFSLPEEVKATIDKRHSRHFRGWESVGSESTNNRVDSREQIDLWSDAVPEPVDTEPAYRRLLGPNQWLADDVLPGYREVFESWTAELQRVGREVLDMLSLGLGLDEKHLSNIFGSEPMSLTKIIHYPPTPEGGAGVNAHHDTGFVTVLAPGETPGLEVQNADGDWIAVPNVAHGLVLNLGEMLQAMTGNYLAATPHRVITPTERYSTGHFLGPSLDTPLVALPLDASYRDAVAASPRHANAGYMAQGRETEAGVGDMGSDRVPELYGEQIWNYLVRSYPEITALHYPQDSTRSQTPVS